MPRYGSGLRHLVCLSNRDRRVLEPSSPNDKDDGRLRFDEVLGALTPTFDASTLSTISLSPPQPGVFDTQASSTFIHGPTGSRNRLGHFRRWRGSCSRGQLRWHSAKLKRVVVPKGWATKKPFPSSDMGSPRGRGSKGRRRGTESGGWRGYRPNDDTKLEAKPSIVGRSCPPNHSSLTNVIHSTALESGYDIMNISPVPSYIGSYV